jgi:hypothetical protein
MSVRCKTCDIGELLMVKKYRMSGVVVAIGYIFLIPSILGMLVTTFAFGQALRHTDSTIFGSTVYAMLLVLIVLSFVGGLLGWLLVMKKAVLQCNNCGAVVPAS